MKKGHATRYGEDDLDPEKLRSRVIDALGRLGTQRFSTEPGGYNLAKWLKSWNFLLDDFEKKLGEIEPPPEFKAKREEVSSGLLSSSASADLETTMEEMRKESALIKGRLESERDRLLKRLEEINDEKSANSKEATDERAKLEKLREEQRSASFFSRLLGKQKEALSLVEKRIGELDASLRALEKEATELHATKKSIERAKDADPSSFDEDWRKLDEISQNLERLDGELRERMQLSRERQKVCEEMISIISRIEIPNKQEAT